MSLNKSAFEKRVKRRITARSQQFFAVCAPGLTRLCKKEIENLPSPLESIEVIPGGVLFSGLIQSAYEANLMLRSPSRILMRIARFKAENFRSLRKKLGQIEWELYLKKGTAVNVEVTTKHSRLYHTEAIAQRTQELITGHFDRLTPSEYLEAESPPLIAAPSRSQETARTPSSDMTQTVMIRAKDDLFEISLDSSGDLLHKRGIKAHVGRAPLRETLAFAVLQATGYTGKIPLVDGMCGSGSFVLEAAMIACNIPPGYYRSFAFEAWPGFRSAQWQHTKKKASQQIIDHDTPQIHAMDLNRDRVAHLDETIRRLNLSFAISVKQQDFFEFQPHSIGPGRSGQNRPNQSRHPNGIVVLNPPYGIRLGDKSDIHALYNEIGKKLASDFKGWRAGIILPEKSLLDLLPTPKTLIPLFHGGLDLHGGVFQL